MTVYTIYVNRPTGLKQLSSSATIELDLLIWLLHSDMSRAEQHRYISENKYELERENTRCK